MTRCKGFGETMTSNKGLTMFIKTNSLKLNPVGQDLYTLKMIFGKYILGCRKNRD